MPLEYYRYPKQTPDEIFRLKQMNYAQYRATPYWQARERAKFEAECDTCERCGRSLRRSRLRVLVIVDRRGEERDEDLEVVCWRCEEGEGAVREERRPEDGRRHELVAWQTVGIDFQNDLLHMHATDFREAYMARLRALKLPTYDQCTHWAIGKILDEKTKRVVAAMRAEAAKPKTYPVEEFPPNKFEAQDILKKLHITDTTREFPLPSGGGIADKQEAAAARLAAYRCPACRQKNCVQPSGMTPGSLWCNHCHHKWAITARDFAALR